MKLCAACGRPMSEKTAGDAHSSCYRRGYRKTRPGPDPRLMVAWEYIVAHPGCRAYEVARAVGYRSTGGAFLPTMESHGFLLAEVNGKLEAFARVEE